MTTIRHHFDSAAEYMAWATDGKLECSANRAEYVDVLKASKASFYGLPSDTDTDATAEGVRAIVNAGWTDGAARTRRQADAVEIVPLPSVRRRRVRGDHGDSIDMARVYAGALDTAWSRSARAEAATVPRVRIVVNQATPGVMHGPSLFWRGAAALAVADRLTEAGYMVQIVSGFAAMAAPVAGKRQRAVCSVTVKDWRTPIDLPTLAATCALAGFFRAFGFLALLKMSPVELNPGLGTPTEPTAADFDDDAHITLIAGDNVQDEAAARKWAADAIAATYPDAIRAAA